MTDASRFRPARRSLLKAGAAGLAAAAVPFAPNVRAQSVPVIRYATGGGIGPNEIQTVIFLDWMQKNVLKNYGKAYTVDMTFTRGTPEAATLLAAGQADMATLSFAVFANTLVKDAVPGGLTVVADNYQDGREGYAGMSYFVLDGSPIKSVADLKGKKIAINAYGSAVDLALRVRLKKEGIDPRKDAQIVEIGFPNIAAAIREGRVDCGVLILPFMANEQSKGGLRVVFNGGESFGEFAPIFHVVTNSYLKAQPAAVKAFLADYVQGLQWLYDPKNRAKAVEITAAFTKTPAPVLDAYFMTKGDYYRDPNACISPALIQRPIDAMYKEGLLPKPIDVAANTNLSLLPFGCKA